MLESTYLKLKRSALALMLAITSFAAGTAAAQDFTVGWHPRSGDVWVDTWLGDMNRYGARYPEPFIDEMVRYHNAPRSLVVDLLQTRRWAPGDVYYACSIASIIGRPCRYVVEQWERDHGQGWGALAQRLGIKPGSAEFHRLKRGFVPTYDRWARPIRIDQDLVRDFPNRGNGHRKSDDGPGNSGNNDKRGQAASAKPGRAAVGKGAGSGGGKGKHGDKGKGNDKGKDKGGKGNGKG